MQGSWSLSIFCHKHLFPGEPSAHKIIIITKELCHMVSYDYVTVGWKNAWPWLLFSIKKFSTKCQNLSHQRLKSKQELFSIFWGIFVFVTFELLFQRWIPGFSFETFGYLGFRQINLNNFSLCSQLWDTSTTEKTRTNLDWKLFVFNYHVRFKDIKLLGVLLN